MTPEEDAKIDWSLTTWKGSRLQQHREFYALSFREKLQVVEELADFGRALAAKRVQKNTGDSPGNSIKRVINIPSE